MNKKKEEFIQYLKWVKNKQTKIEKYKRRKKKRAYKKLSKVGLVHRKYDIKIVFPEVIDMYNIKRCEETLDFFNRKFDDIEQYKNGVVFDFSRVKRITLSGGIVMRCFYDFLLSKNTKIKCSGLIRNKVIQILCHIGILIDASIKITYKDISRWNIKYWNKKETSRNKFNLELISEIIKATTGWGEQSRVHRRLYEVVPEILFNCIQHAYNDDNSFQYFYLFSGIADNKYVFCILDKGIGFKATYLKWHNNYLDFNDINNDGDYIKYSIQQGHSSINISGRGNGLFTLKENIMELGGMIFIHSYSGKVVVSKKNEEINSENRYPLCGSLVQFEIPMLKHGA
jgi:hypothetical protein